MTIIAQQLQRFIQLYILTLQPLIMILLVKVKIFDKDEKSDIINTDLSGIRITIGCPK